MTLSYHLVQVFAETAAGGNPLAVVLDGTGHDTAEMQAVAARTGVSETVFVLPAERPHHSAAIRIFTRRHELPFAGHPTIGTAVLLASRRPGPGPEERNAVVVLEEGVGPVRCGVVLRGDTGYGLMDSPRPPREAGAAPDREAIATALGLGAEAIGFEHHLPTIFEAGVPFLFVPVANLAAIGSIRSNVEQLVKSAGVEGVYCYTKETVAVGRQYHARMFAPAIGEDPATGNAAAAFAGVVDRFEALGEGTRRLVIEQGFEMKRPSLVGLEIDRAPGRVEAVRVGGEVLILGERMLEG